MQTQQEGEACHREDFDTVRLQLPTVKANICGQVLVCNWADEGQRQQAVLELQNFAACLKTDRPIHGLFQPLHLCGALAQWPAVQRWSLSYLAEHYPDHKCFVRVAPNQNFKYVDPKLLKLYLKLRSPRSLPSMLLPMACQEFAQRMQKDCNLPNLVYKQAEFYYMQGPTRLSTAMKADMRLTEAPFSTVLDPSLPGQPLSPTVAPHLWVSPEGAVSPLHYDCSPSFLVQLHGSKRMLLWPPQQLSALSPYPNFHILRRRARVDPCQPNYKKFPAFQHTAAIEVTLHAGDVLFFPAYWAHYTESLTLSISLTCRFDTKRRKQQWSRNYFMTSSIKKT